MNQPVVLGVDIGGSHITAALVDLNGNAVLESSWRRSRINSSAPADEILDRWSEVMLESLHTANHAGKIGIAMPGPFDYAKGISYMSGQGKYDALFELDVKAGLLQRLQPVAGEILFMNDATCFLHGEATAGVARCYERVLGFTLGTGFGSATCSNGVTSDAHYWQHPFLEGTCEDYFSSRWFIRRYKELTGFAARNVKEITEDESAPERVTQLFNEFTDNMALLLSEVLGREGYDAVVFGGNIANASRFFLPSLKRQHQASLLISTLGENAALIGSACYHRVSAPNQEPA